ncbi:DUF2971 domain-containing protein [Schleiferilactobacillus harbinensis]|uniref:DUF2971 domain-containing protein n=1 Tax=Schleiferilactobacillus harbinensis TaxID=304207 RepID=UPI0021A436D9|nr:DUF2971 domain-containing protein [Schleiferilactobacillus harbinensis]MCT2908953.1 DUF2971 domain-containing protein [Schleiferilactobacillus harbinensis]
MARIQAAEHYTTVEAFRAIIRTRILRLTRTEFLNDPNDTQVWSHFMQKFVNANQQRIAQTVNAIAGDDGPQLLQLYWHAPIEGFMTFMQQRIKLYVMALSTDEDAIPMWNYYGYGGMEMSLDLNGFMQDLQGQLRPGSHEYIGASRVIYVDSHANITKAHIASDFQDFLLADTNNLDLFTADREALAARHQPTDVFERTDLGQYIDDFIESYIWSLRYLAKTQRVIGITTTPAEIYTRLFENDTSARGEYAWKKDLLLLFVMLTAAMKSDSYSYEKEYRVFYFDASLSETPQKQENFDIQALSGQKYLRPYVELAVPNLANYLTRVTLSPQTQNLPVDVPVYLDVIQSLLRQYGFQHVTVASSQQQIRW